MKNITIITNPAVKEKFDAYPKEVLPKLVQLRELIIETAAEEGSIHELEETLKWGEPSYLVKKGSTIRIDWKAKAPHQYAMYFKCTSKLVPTFIELFGDSFNYEKTRAIVFNLDQEIPADKLKVCIRLALKYHHLKHLPLLGE